MPVHYNAIIAAQGVSGNHCKAEFEFWAHARVARAEGLPDSVIDALKEGSAVPYEDDLQRLIHTAAKDLVETGRPTHPFGRAAGRCARLAGGGRAGRAGWLLLHGLVYAQCLRGRTSGRCRADLESPGFVSAGQVPHQPILSD
jgi:hypothetical protein